MQAQTMTLDEKFAITRKAFELLDAGDREGYSRTIRTAPMPPYLAATGLISRIAEAALA